MKVAIALSTRDRVELTKRTIEPLLQPDKFDLFWVDGSMTEAGQKLAFDYVTVPAGKNTVKTPFNYCNNVRGGADAAIVYSLSTMLDATEWVAQGGNQYQAPKYDYVGLVENDVLLGTDFFEPMMELFAKGERIGLDVGAVSARCYEDRILFQADDFAVMHNAGAGMIVLTREAAELVLANFRTGWAPDNRATFAMLANVDIGPWWAFAGNQQWITADWHWDVVLARHGLASLALVPNKVEMIGQVPPLEQQGLRYANAPVEARRNDKAFRLYATRLRAIREGRCVLPALTPVHNPASGWAFFPHQLGLLKGCYQKTWKLKWCQGFGPFSFVSGAEGDSIQFQAYGPVSVIIGSAEEGARFVIHDTHTGLTLDPPPIPLDRGSANFTLPADMIKRDIYVEALTPGVQIFGVVTERAQPLHSVPPFRHSHLPPVD